MPVCTNGAKVCVKLFPGHLMIIKYKDMDGLFDKYLSLFLSKFPFQKLLKHHIHTLSHARERRMSKIT